MEEESPPSYTDTMAAIAEGMRHQGIQTPSSLNPEDLSGDSFVVIFPPSSTSRSFRSGSSIQSVDTNIQGPPPAYPEHTSRGTRRTSAEPVSHNTEPSFSFIGDQRTSSLDADVEKVSVPVSLQDATQSHRMVPLPQTGAQSDRKYFPGFPRPSPAASNIRDDAILSDGASWKPLKHNPSLPGRIVIEQYEHVISSSSPAAMEIRWRVPENATHFTGLIYVVETNWSSHPLLSVTPITKPIDRETDDDHWVEIIDTAKPFIRLFRTQSMLTIGHAKWALNQSSATHGLKMWFRVRAVDGYNRLPSCKKGPWSEEFKVHFIETGGITKSQENAWKKSQEAAMGTSDISKQDKDAEPLTFALSAFYAKNAPSATTASSAKTAPSATAASSSLSTDAVNIHKLEYYIHSDSPTETRITWERPSNSGKFRRMFYEIQSMQEPPQNKGPNATRFKQCVLSESWKTIADTQSSPLRLYKFPKHVSIGRTRWDFSPHMAPYTLLLRIRLVGMMRDFDGVSEGPWSDTVRIHVQAEKPVSTQ
ncbi:uncharacterized protein LOC124290154 isoform X2 [Haliotis rubra]|uniref:uncharacterized protein LOC124290154 isoform X2 n=1 Tax=Haliotis rubra TaxID=36100 RepID=UPI001EE5FAB7|nr:uncharacterized protein LOC124290154 isoform X2 [Haliotis rubra]